MSVLDGQYVLGDTIGQGGFGKVKAAVNSLTNEKVNLFVFVFGPLRVPFSVDDYRLPRVFCMFFIQVAIKIVDKKAIGVILTLIISIRSRFYPS